MKPVNKNVKRNKFKEFFLESWSVYLVVSIVLLAIGIGYASLSGDNYFIIILGIIFVVSFMMMIEFIIWKKKN
jgi:uncharacterized membrane protein YiaA